MLDELQWERDLIYGLEIYKPNSVTRESYKI